MTRQNILVMLLDGVQAAYLSCYGCRQATTPFLDGLAREGIRYANAISPATWSVPGHASLFTGLYLSEHRMNAEQRRLSPQIVTLAEVLADAGYRTAMFSNNRMVGPKTGLDQGFQVVVPKEKLESRYVARLPQRIANRVIRDTILREYVGLTGWTNAEESTIQELLAWLRGHRSTGKPFFAFVNLWTAHAHRAPPHRFLRPWVRERRLARLIHDYGSPLSHHFNAGALKPSEDTIHYAPIIYLAAVRYLDHVLQTALRALRKEGLLEDTLIIIAADHGDQVGEHGLWAHELSVYDALIKVPLILVGPALSQRGIVYRPPVQLCDIFPTLLSLSGIDKRAFPYQTRRPSLIDRIQDPPDAYPYAFSEFYDDGGGLTQRLLSMNPDLDRSVLRGLVSVRSWRYKYIQAVSGQDEFYDLLVDPEEQDNLIDDPPAIVMEMQRALADWRLGLHDFGIHYKPSDGVLVSKPDAQRIPG